LGGDEFAVLLPDLDPDDGRAVIDRVRLAVAGQGTGSCRLTISAGCVHVDRFSPGRELLTRADEALRIAKRSGRNRTVVHAASS
jgi:diguanylate cyclase (GGDEF)-like protein